MRQNEYNEVCKTVPYLSLLPYHVIIMIYNIDNCTIQFTYNCMHIYVHNIHEEKMSIYHIRHFKGGTI